MPNKSTIAAKTSPVVGATPTIISTTSSFAAGTFIAASAPSAPWTSIVYATSTADILSINDSKGVTLVKMKHDGTVEWPNGVQVDEAATSFATTLTRSALNKVGITENVMKSMRDSVFNDLIDVATQKGPLSADDLTYLLSASKIMEKLKGQHD